MNRLWQIEMEIFNDKLEIATAKDPLQPKTWNECPWDESRFRPSHIRPKSKKPKTRQELDEAIAAAEENPERVNDLEGEAWNNFMQVEKLKLEKEAKTKAIKTEMEHYDSVRKRVEKAASSIIHSSSSTSVEHAASISTVPVGYKSRYSAALNTSKFNPSVGGTIVGGLDVGLGFGKGLFVAKRTFVVVEAKADSVLRYSKMIKKKEQYELEQNNNKAPAPISSHR